MFVTKCRIKCTRTRSLRASGVDLTENALSQTVADAHEADLSLPQLRDDGSVYILPHDGRSAEPVVASGSRRLSCWLWLHLPGFCLLAKFTDLYFNTSGAVDVERIYLPHESVSGATASPLFPSTTH